MAAPHLPIPRHRLRTFGTLALAAPDDETILGTHGHHRRRLALLAVLAAAGEVGRSRDQLLLLFWPDATQTRARHSLDQLLYALRSSIDGALFASVNPVRLNAEVIDSDVAAFNAACDRGDLATAVAEYRGRFLDGFYLDDAPEFEQWMEAERGRLAARYAGALERLAERAAALHDDAAALRWWRLLAETDGVSGRYAAGVMRALLRAGDHAAALQHARRYEALVGEQLGVSVDPAVATLVEEIRGRTHAPRRAVPYLAWAIVVAILSIGSAVLSRWRSREPPTGRTTSAAPSIVVLPLVNVSRDPVDAPIVDGLTDELIGALSNIANLRVVARTSALAFRNSVADVRQIADSLGVTHVLEGSVQKSGRELRVQAPRRGRRARTA